MADKLHPLDITDPPPPEQRIDTLYAWIATQMDGAEGICAGIIPELGSTPLVTSRRHVAINMETVARRVQQTAAKAGKPIKIALVTYRREE